MKKIVLVLFIMCLTGCSSNAKTSNISTKENPASIFIATDPHFISDKVNDYGESFMLSIENADGKMTQYSNELVDALISETIEARPDALIISGDLTLLGAKDSHIDFAQKFKAVQDNGVPVLLMPGNHDIDSFSAVKFSDMTYLSTETVSTEEFSEIYADFGYKDCLSKDKTSLSYFYEIRPDLWVLMLDVNASDEYNGVSDKTYNWIKSQLKKAKKAGAQVISVTHQNTLAHSPLFSQGYIINNVDRLLELYKEYDVSCNFTGHLHIQHISKSDDFTEVAMSSLATSPNQYGHISFDGSELDYQSNPVDVVNWAKSLGKTDANLLDFSNYSKEFFHKTAFKQSLHSLRDIDMSEERRSDMSNHFAKIHGAYFAGTMTAELATDPISKLWLENGSSSNFYNYIKSMLDDADKENNSLKLQVIK